ncbi:MULTISPECIES: lytic transglycosylase domain-containing protein [unclassified Tolypothrix]|uniref:lytic transglycosylase domain-containing protein n=1 Tax=unclassified Tolypothrix TaxID=2649714 RepID=UPI0005EAA2C8|nr:MULTISPECIES: transglycosylase SLT domain-containing protein [unclassified Tolypothrix]BAY91579.1 lytic transglycosylase [Microchaete diplosiphon NIES-3275]EKF05336.1 transglycosylase SLT domain protein [Tolypothrix sp. PCC 7601]MBE9087626.1 transglycosylase SLT domain-containing protein [Tolypothrix sp. LEGE 11397]UYD25607.1 transglycosylase SLT domain-containing protein [Tolypothrix sp. PCC 7712]UYD32152.1 transglycosylase SLT domain-containing protein [Tolypothrix sp. PCC 7601]
MLKQLKKNPIPVIAGAGLCAFLAGAMVSAPQLGKSVGQWLKYGNEKTEQISEASKAKSAVYPLVSKSLPERAAKLAEIAENSRSPDRERARYLLASDYVERTQGKKALVLLQGLEKEYPILAPYILLKQAQAQDLLGEDGKASDLRQKVLKQYPKTAATVKAIYLIAQPKQQDIAIAQFPTHPLTWEIIRKRLDENPQQPQLQLKLAQYAADQPGTVGVLDDLAKESTLKPEDWEIIGTAYWANNQFEKAAKAYAKAPKTPRSLYRAGRGLQVAGKERDKAIATYKQLVQQFPEAPESGTALLRLAEMAKTRKDALPYLDQAIAKFPNVASQAVVEKAKIYQTLKDNKSAAQAWQLLIGKYANSDEAAEYRWKIAQEKANAKDYIGAWQWAEPIPTNNPTSILAPRAGFWVGKWATQLGKQQEAKTAYEYVISQFPYSYYAWRSAAVLGLNVGNFNNLRQMQPEVVPPQRPVPPAGSETFKELYLLGQDRDAWLQWETEFVNKDQPTVAEQFTEGLMQLARGENKLGIDTISKLEDREIPEEKAEYQTLSQQITYWQARYPFPYVQEIEKWSKERQINPLLVTALIRQESRFEANAKSVANAMGLMQVLPSTAQWIAPQIKVDGKTLKLEDPNDNIMLGTWYLDHTHQQYSNNSLLAIASYNAGPGNVAKWLQTLPTQDPDEFVEKIPFDETRNYVRQVLGNYWNYLRLYNPEISALVAQYSSEHPKLPSK